VRSLARLEQEKIKFQPWGSLAGRGDFVASSFFALAGRQKGDLNSILKKRNACQNPRT